MKKVVGRDSRVPSSGSAVSSCSHSPYLLFSLQRCASAARSKTLSRKLGPGWNHGGTHDAQTSLRGLDAKLHELSRVKLSDTNNNHYQKNKTKKSQDKKVCRRWKLARLLPSSPALCPGETLSAEHKSTGTFSYNPSSPRSARWCARLSAKLDAPTPLVFFLFQASFQKKKKTEKKRVKKFGSKCASASRPDSRSGDMRRC